MANQKLARIRQNNERTENPQANAKFYVGASLLAMDVNDNARHQAARVVYSFFASKLAPTVKTSDPTVLDRWVRS
jgi:hypothetical protein